MCSNGALCQSCDITFHASKQNNAFNVSLRKLKNHNKLRVVFGPELSSQAGQPCPRALVRSLSCALATIMLLCYLLTAAAYVTATRAVALKLATASQGQSFFDCTWHDTPHLATC